MKSLGHRPRHSVSIVIGGNRGGRTSLAAHVARISAKWNETIHLSRENALIELFRILDSPWLKCFRVFYLNWAELINATHVLPSILVDLFFSFSFCYFFLFSFFLLFFVSFFLFLIFLLFSQFFFFSEKNILLLIFDFLFPFSLFSFPCFPCFFFWFHVPFFLLFIYFIYLFFFKKIWVALPLCQSSVGMAAVHWNPQLSSPPLPFSPRPAGRWKPIKQPEAFSRPGRAPLILIATVQARTAMNITSQ